MMRLARSSAEMPGVVIAALRRRGRRRPSVSRFPNNNYLAEGRVTTCRSFGKSPIVDSAAVPKRGQRPRKPGAPAGNRNALTCGRYTAERKARRARIRAVIKRLRFARVLAEQLLALNRIHAMVLDI